MTTKQIANLTTGSIVGIKLPYLKNIHKDCFPEVAVVIRKSLNDFIVIEDSRGMPSIWKNTELDLLERN